MPSFCEELLLRSSSCCKVAVPNLFTVVKSWINCEGASRRSSSSFVTQPNWRQSRVTIAIQQLQQPNRHRHRHHHHHLYSEICMTQCQSTSQRSSRFHRTTLTTILTSCFYSTQWESRRTSACFFFRASMLSCRTIGRYNPRRRFSSCRPKFPWRKSHRTPKKEWARLSILSRQTCQPSAQVAHLLTC